VKQQSVIITTPLPTLAETAKELGMSKTRVKRIMTIMECSKEKIKEVLEEM